MTADPSSPVESGVVTDCALCSRGDHAACSADREDENGFCCCSGVVTGPVEGERMRAASMALEARLRMYLASSASGAVGWGASVQEITQTVLTAADAVDPLRAGPGDKVSGAWTVCGVRVDLDAPPAGPGEGQYPPTVADVRSAAHAMLRWCDDDTAERQVLGSILTPLLPEVAARVRAERLGDPDIAAGRDEFARRIRAEAVADERQRIATAIRAKTAAEKRTQVGPDAGYTYWDGHAAGMELAADVAAGSVPAATPEPATCAQGLKEGHVIDPKRPHLNPCPGPAVTLALKHEPARDGYGVLVCNACTKEERREVGGVPVAMYWDSCPYNPAATPTEPATATTPGGVTIPASVCLTCADQWFECPDCGGSRHRSAEQDGQR